MTALFFFFSTHLEMVGRRAKWPGIVLIVLVGLLNFHVPHFLLESHSSTGSASTLLELVLFANVLGAVVAAFGIWRNRRWGWHLGLLIAALSFVLYSFSGDGGTARASEELGGTEAGLVSLLVEGLFAILAGLQVGRREKEKGR